MPETQASRTGLPQISCIVQANSVLPSQDRADSSSDEQRSSNLTPTDFPIMGFRQIDSRARRQVLPGDKIRVNPFEAGLIRRILRGENEVFHQLVRPYATAVLRTARAILHNDSDAEDVAQEAVLKAFTNLANFRCDARFSTWLIRIVINQALMQLRKERRQRVYSLDEPCKNAQGDYIFRDFADRREIPSEALQNKELRYALLRALGSLAPKYREVFVLRDVRHFSISETANLLGVTKSVVKTRLLRARLQMRDALALGIDGKGKLVRSESRPMMVAI